MEAVIATLMAISESPPRSKKLAFRSIEPTPRHSAQMRCNVASIGELPLVDAWAWVSGASRRRGRRPVRRSGTLHPLCGGVVVYPMPLPFKGIAGKRDELRPVAAPGCPVDIDTR